jgi:hypothetical protein
MHARSRVLIASFQDSLLLLPKFNGFCSYATLGCLVASTKILEFYGVKFPKIGNAPSGARKFAKKKNKK